MTRIPGAISRNRLTLGADPRDPAVEQHRIDGGITAQ